MPSTYSDTRMHSLREPLPMTMVATSARTASAMPAGWGNSSPRRARRTAKLLWEGGGWSTEIPLRSTHAFYEAEPADILAELRRVDQALRAVVVVGHEPTWSTVVSRLVGTAKVSLSPGTCVRIDSQIGWADIAFGDGILRWMIPPALLGGR